MQGAFVDSFEKVLLRLKQNLGIQADKDIAELLGMSPTAFNARKKRDSFPEDKLLALIGRRPDLSIDPDFVLDGQILEMKHHGREGLSYAELSQQGVREGRARDIPSAALSVDELELLALYRAAPLKIKMKVVAILSDEEPTGAADKNPAVKVKGRGNRAAGRDFNERS